MGTMGDDSATVPKSALEPNPRKETGCVKRTFHEGGYALLVLQRLCLLDEIDLVLQDDDVLELHNLDGSQML